jgi:hypothetical protein
LELDNVTNVANKVFDQGDNTLKLSLNGLKGRNVEVLDERKDAFDLGLNSGQNRGGFGGNEGKDGLDLHLNLGDGITFSAREVEDLDLAQNTLELALDSRELASGGFDSSSGSASDGTLTLGCLDTVLLASVEVVTDVITSMVQTRVQG